MYKDIFCGVSSEEERQRVLAQLKIAAWMGLIPSADPEAVEERRRQKNAEIERRIAVGEVVYGLTHYTPAVYQQYELTRFKLDYTVYKGERVGDYPYTEIAEEQKRTFYDENRDLFTRYFGDSFRYDEVSMIIEKRLREREYERIVHDLAYASYKIPPYAHTLLKQSSSPDQADRDAGMHTAGTDMCMVRTGDKTVGGYSQGDLCNERIRSYALSSEAAQRSMPGGKTWYVSSVNGSDENDGRSREKPFGTLFAVNRVKLYPGDQVLLERGSVFRGQYLHLSVCGTKEAPILIGAYGEGALPRIEAQGQGIWYQDYGTELDSPTHTREGYVSSAVLLYDCSYVTLRDLSVTNQGEIIGERYGAPHKMNRTGVAVVAQNGGTLREIHLADLEIRNVNGNVYDKHMNNGGIYFTCLKPEHEEETGVARYEGISVTGCLVQKVSRWGIAVGYSYRCREFMKAELEEELFIKYGHKDIRIADNYVKEAGGDGITVMYALRPLVEHNTADSCAGEMNDRIYRFPEKRGGKVAAGIWPWKCKDALLQYNEAADTRLNQDGMAWDADSGDGTVYQYNYSRLNEGGCVMFCLEEAVHNTFRYNLSHDDLGGTISPSMNPDACLYHNIFRKRKGVPFVREHMDGGNFVEEENLVEEI